MAMVAAICSQCGAKISVDNTLDAGICEFCGTAFVTEKVIIDQLPGINNLLLRAKYFEDSSNPEKAAEYFNRVLDIDINNAEANTGLKRLAEKEKRQKELASEFIVEYFRSQSEFQKETKERKQAEKIDAYCDYIKARDELHNSQGKCYIATAVYGSYDCPQVWTLRRFRDYSLAETWYGRMFIHIYYAISPSLVKWFGNKSWFKSPWKLGLDKMVEHLNKDGIENTPYSDREW